MPSTRMWRCIASLIASVALIINGFALAPGLASAAASGYYFAIANGAWNAPTGSGVWQTCTNAAGTTGCVTAAVTAPTTTANVVTVKSGVLIHVNSAVTADQVVVAAGGQLVVDAAFTLTLNNGAGSDLTVNGAVAVSGTLSYLSAAAIDISGSLSTTSGAAIKGGAAASVVTVKTGGSFTIGSGSTYTVTGLGAATLNVNAGGSATINGAVSGIPNMAMLGTLTTSASMTMTGSVVSQVVVGGAFTMTAGTLTATRANGGYAIQVKSPGTLALTGTSTAFVGTVATAHLDVLSGGTLDLGPSAYVSGAGLVAISSGATLKIGDPNGITTGTGATSGNIRTAGLDTYNTGGNYEYKGTAAQVTGAALPATAITGSVRIASPAGVTPTGNLLVNSAGKVEVLNGGNLRLLPSGAGSLVSGTGKFLLDSGGTLQIGSVVGITAAGDTGNVQTTTRTFDIGANYVYNGSAAQATGTGLPLTANSITVNNGAGVILTRALTLTNGGSVTSGALNLGEYNVTAAGSSTLAVTGTGSISRSTGYVIGNLQKIVPTGSPTVTFEMGTAGASTPVTVKFSGVTTGGSLKARATSNDHPSLGSSTINPAKSLNSYYTLTNAGIALGSYDATFGFSGTFGATDGRLDTGTNSAALGVGRFAGGTWAYPTIGARTATSTQITGQTGFGDFAIGEMADRTPPVVTIDSTVPSLVNGSGNSIVTWHADETGTLSVRVGGATCTSGTAIEGPAAYTAPSSHQSTVLPASLAEGANTIRVCVTDPAANAGQATTSVTKDLSALVVDLTPVPSTIFATETLAATATYVQGIASVEFLVDGSVIGTDTTAPFAVVFDTTTVTDGSHSLGAYATGTDGHVGSSTPMSVTVANALPPSQRIDADYAAGRLSADEYALDGIYALGAPEMLSDRYSSATAVTENTTDIYRFLQGWDSLETATRDEINAFLDQPLRGAMYRAVAVPQGTPVPANIAQALANISDPCVWTESGIHVGPFGVTFASGLTCHHDTSDGRFKIFYTVEGSPDSYFARDSIPETDVLGVDTQNPSCGPCPNQVPDYVDKLVTGLEEAYDIYSGTGPGQLQYPVWPGPISVSIWNVPGGLTTPNPFGRTPFITIPSTHGWELYYLGHHELFHVFQYKYVRLGALQVNQFSGGPAWWIEATADWAAGYVVRSNHIGDGIPNVRLPEEDATRYADKISEFLGRPNEVMSTYENPLVTIGWCGCRQYGLSVFAEYLRERFGADFIQEVFEKLADDAGGQLVRPALEAAALAPAHNINLATILPHFALANYLLSYDDTVAGGAPSDVNVVWRETKLAGDPRTQPTPSGSDIAPARPARVPSTIAFGGTVQGTEVVHGIGAAAYIELRPDPLGQRGKLSISVTQHGQGLDARVMSLTYPTTLPYAPTICGDPVPVTFDDQGTGSVSVPVGSACKYAVLILTGLDTEVSADWSAHLVPAGPSIVFVTKPITAATQHNVLASGSAEPDDRVDLRISDGHSAHDVTRSTTGGASGLWSFASLDLAGLDDGSLTFLVAATDAYGNVGYDAMGVQRYVHSGTWEIPIAGSWQSFSDRWELPSNVAIDALGPSVQSVFTPHTPSNFPVDSVGRAPLSSLVSPVIKGGEMTALHPFNALDLTAGQMARLTGRIYLTDYAGNADTTQNVTAWNHIGFTGATDVHDAYGPTVSGDIGLMIGPDYWGPDCDSWPFRPGVATLSYTGAFYNDPRHPPFYGGYYNVILETEYAVMRGKIWPAGETEPTDWSYNVPSWGSFFHPVISGIYFMSEVRLCQDATAIYDGLEWVYGGHLRERFFQLGSYTNMADQLRLQYIVP